MRRLPPLVLLLACERGEPSPEPDPATAELARLIVGGTPGVLEYAEIDELAPAQRGRRVRVHGFVTDDPIERSSDGSRVRFVVARGSAKLAVEHVGVLPERFQPKLEVVLTGTLSEDGTHIASDELVAKCPDRYEVSR